MSVIIRTSGIDKTKISEANKNKIKVKGINKKQKKESKKKKKIVKKSVKATVKENKIEVNETIIVDKKNDKNLEKTGWWSK